MLRAGERTTKNAVGIFGWFFSRMRGGENSYVVDSRRIPGSFARREGGQGNAGNRTLFNGGAVVARSAGKKSKGDRTRDLTFWLINGGEGEGEVMGFHDYRRPFPDPYLSSLENPSCDSLFHDENIYGDKRDDWHFISRYDRGFQEFIMGFRLRANNTSVIE